WMSANAIRYKNSGQWPAASGQREGTTPLLATDHWPLATNPGGYRMLTMLGSERRCCDGLTRRETLKAGALSLLGGGFTLPHLFAAEERARTCGGGPAKPQSVILPYLLGGAATQDMWDMKPSAPAEVRGEFKPIATNVPGLQVCEHLA